MDLLQNNDGSSSVLFTKLVSFVVEKPVGLVFNFALLKSIRSKSSYECKYSAEIDRAFRQMREIVSWCENTDRRYHLAALFYSVELFAAGLPCGDLTEESAKNDQKRSKVVDTAMYL